MNNLKLKILKHVYAKAQLTVGGLADQISPSHRTEKDIEELVKIGYLRYDRCLHLTNKGRDYIDFSSRRNQMIQVGKCALAMAGGVVIATTAQ